MNLQETCAYIDHGLAIAYRQEKLFSDTAKTEIYKRTNGIARKINTLCYQAIVRDAIEKKNPPGRQPRGFFNSNLFNP